MSNSPAPELIDRIHPRIRGRFPTLDRDAQGRRRIYLNSGAGSLMVDTAVEAAAAANRTLNPMPGSICPGEVETASFHEGVRALTADFLNAIGGREISFHVSTTAALFNLAFSYRDEVRPEDNLIVTDLDHMANISAWETVLGEGCGVEVRRARVSAEGSLDVEHFLSLVDDRTRLVAVTMASNGFGTVPPLAEIVAEVRKKAPNCQVVVDAVHHALHGPIDVRAIGCDALAFSGYKVFGPMLGVLWVREPGASKLRPYRVETNKDAPPWKFEQGMLNNASLASLRAALEYLLWVAEEAGASGHGFVNRRERFVFAMKAVAAYESRLTRRVLESFQGLPKERFTAFGLTDPDRSAERDPTFAFEIPGQTATETKTRLWEESAIQIADGNHYSAAVTRHLGKPALCRASFAHYDTAATADLFLDGLARLTGSGK
jgi:cysteine desulfurase family protein (TIGR01976 family)